MKDWIVLATMLGLLAGCVGRIPLYSPRLPPTPEHRAATSHARCLECHDLADRKNHGPTDDCRDCHTICEGC